MEETKRISIKKSVLILFAILIAILSLIAGLVLWGARPYSGYGGENEALYTEAVYSVFGARPYFSYGDQVRDPVIEIVEEDDYGRIMYAYKTYAHCVNLLIMQKSDGEDVYYYPDINFIQSDEFDGLYPLDSTEAMYKEGFGAEDIMRFKTANDFGEPLEMDKCIKMPLVRKKTEPKIQQAHTKIFEDIFARISEQTGDVVKYLFNHFLVDDANDKMLFGAFGYDKDNVSDEVCCAVIINADLSYDADKCFVVFENKNDWKGNNQDLLKRLKEDNGWVYD